MTVITHKNGKQIKSDYVVTVTQEHFVNVRASDDEEAQRRAIDVIRDRWGGGRNPQVIEVELIS